jgi:SAM-dependent methyltransferase
MAQASKDNWAAGDLYEPYVGRWSRKVAPEFLRWLHLLASERWLDLGCGTGALTQAILAHAAPATVQGIDPSPGFIAHAQAHIQDPRVSFAVGDAQAIPLDANSVDVAVAGLVLNFVPEPERALTEMVRVTRPGGTVAAYVWDYAGKMELMRYFWDAAAALDPKAQDEGPRFAFCQPDPLQALFEQAGLQAVQVQAIDVPTVFRDFDDYWSPFLGGQGPAPAYAMSLSEADRAALRERIRAALPQPRGDGCIELMARAWAVRGRRAAAPE